MTVYREIRNCPDSYLYPSIRLSCTNFGKYILWTFIYLFILWLDWFMVLFTNNISGTGKSMWHIYFKNIMGIEKTSTF